jgi:hypothetical protein
MRNVVRPVQKSTKAQKKIFHSNLMNTNDNDKSKTGIELKEGVVAAKGMEILSKVHMQVSHL